MKSLFVKAGCVFGVVLALATAPAVAQEKLILGLVTEPTLHYAPHFLAKTKYFKEEGLDVDVIAFDGSGVLLPQLNAKRVTVGWVAPDLLIAARQPGRDRMPMRFFYNGSRVSPWEIIVRDESPIKQVSDLRGKRIGVLALTAGNVPITKSMFQEMGMQVGKDYELVATAGNAAFHALSKGQVDALNLYDALHAIFEARGMKIRRLPIPEKFGAVPAHGFLVHEDTLRDKRDVLVKIGRGFAKATIACDVNPEACIRNFWELYPNQKPTEGTEAEKMKQGIIVLKAGMRKYLVFGGDPRIWGQFRHQGLQDLINALHSGGQISTASIDPGSLYTAELIAEINKFDTAGVIAEAKAMK
jgi:NitT/TauT family transport system substrate-binding protein